MSNPVSKPRDVDSVLLRLPASVKQLAASIASERNVSQNAFFATAVLTSMIMLGPAPQLGSPENLRELIIAIDGAIEDGFPVIGSFHKVDWLDVTPFVEMLTDLDVIGEVRTKTAAKSPDTVAYTFPVKKVGLALWPTIAKVLLARLENLQEADASMPN